VERKVELPCKFFNILEDLFHLLHNQAIGHLHRSESSMAGLRDIFDLEYIWINSLHPFGKIERSREFEMWEWLLVYNAGGHEA
jgi:hypothetical protein